MTLSDQQRARLQRVKERCRIEEIVRHHGVALMASGDRLVGRCPSHEDHTPSFTVYPASQTFHCFGCGAHGDVITFVQLADGLSFSEALAILDPFGSEPPATRGLRNSAATTGTSAEGTRLRLVGPGPTSAHAREDGPRPSAGGRDDSTATVDTPSPPEPPSDWADPTERQLVLRMATAVYHQTLLRTPAARAYLRARGLSLDVARRCGLGYADGITLPSYLAADAALRQAAIACGLLTRAGRDHLAHRLTIPEIRDGRTNWILGRAVPGAAAERTTAAQQASATRRPGRDEGGSSRDAPKVAPKYLALPGPKPLLGTGSALDQIQQARAALEGESDGRGQQEDRRERLVPALLVVEGALDYVAACDWHLSAPCVALTGTQASAAQLRDLMRVYEAAGRPPLLLALDADAAGQAAAAHLSEQLRRRGMTIAALSMPPGAKDLADLAAQPGGRTRFRGALHQALLQLDGHAPPHRVTASHDLDDLAREGATR